MNPKASFLRFAAGTSFGIAGSRFRVIIMTQEFARHVV